MTADQLMTHIIRWFFEQYDARRALLCVADIDSATDGAASRVLRVALGARDPVGRLFTPAWPGGFRAAEQATVN